MTPTKTGPGARFGVPLAFDPKRRSAVLFSGYLENALDGQTWEYVDQRWRQATTLGPPPRADQCTTYDETLEKVVVVSGTDRLGTPIPDTWLFGYE